jgi:hypothetical protein
MRWFWRLRRDPRPRAERPAGDPRPGASPAADVVERVALELYARALNGGAWALDIGVFGPRLFAPDARDVLWSIALGRAHGEPPVP